MDIKAYTEVATVNSNALSTALQRQHDTLYGPGAPAGSPLVHGAIAGILVYAMANGATLGPLREALIAMIDEIGPQVEFNLMAGKPVGKA